MYSAPSSTTRQMTLRRGAARQARPHLRQARPRPGDHLLEIGTGWGGLAHPRRRRATAAASRRRRSRASSTTTRRRAVREAGLEDRVTVLLRGLPRPRRPLRQARLDRDDRGGRLGAPRHVLRACCSDLLEPDGAMLLQAIVHRRPRLPGREGVEAASSARYIFPGGCLPSLRGDRALRRARAPTCAPSTSRTSPRTTRDAASAGANVRRAADELRRRSATTSASAACGACTSPTARPASPSAASG